MGVIVGGKLLSFFLITWLKLYKARSEVNFQSIFIFRTSSQIAGLRPIPQDWSVPM
jgi:hypothetical protein